LIVLTTLQIRGGDKNSHLGRPPANLTIGKENKTSSQGKTCCLMSSRQNQRPSRTAFAGLSSWMPCVGDARSARDVVLLQGKRLKGLGRRVFGSGAIVYKGKGEREGPARLMAETNLIDISGQGVGRINRRAKPASPSAWNMNARG